MSTSDLAHWQINAKVYDDRVEEIHFITDAARNIRRLPQTQIWRDEKYLGHGAFGVVRLQKNAQDGRTRAVKRIPTSGNISDKECEKELGAHMEFSKPKFREAAVFVDFFGWFKDGANVFLAMEYIALGDLEKNVKALSGRLPESEARGITNQILSALQIMHAESFAHRDLKPQNILVVNGPPKWWVKITDFGVSKRLVDTTVYRTVCGSFSYMAPEILDLLGSDLKLPNAEYTNAVDLWSVGCIVYRLIAGFPPFDISTLRQYCRDNSFPRNHEFESRIRSSGSKFVQELLAADPKERLSASQALDHTWVTSESDILELQDNTLNPEESSTSAGLTISSTRYDTITHNGIKSFAQPSAPGTSQSQADSSINTDPVTEIKSLSVSDRFAISRKPCPPPRPMSNARDTSAGQDATLPKLKSAIPYLKSLEGHTYWVWSVAFSPEGNLLGSASGDETFRLWDVAAGFVISTEKVRSGSFTSRPWVWTVAFSPEDMMVASVLNLKDVQITKILTGATKIFSGHVDSVLCVAFSSSRNVVATASTDKTVRLWSVAKGSLLQTIIAHTDWIRCVTFSDGDLMMASGSDDHTIQIWHLKKNDIGEISTDRERGLSSTLIGHQSAIRTLVFSHNLKFLASASEDWSIRLWNIYDRRAIQILNGHTGTARCLSFTTDDRLLVSASEDKTIRVWDLATRTAQILVGHTAWVTSLAFSPGDKILASASRDNTIKLWDFDSLRRLRVNE